MAKLYYNSLLIISLLAFYGAGVYRLYQLNYMGIFLTLIFSAITFILLKKGRKGNLSSRVHCHCEGEARGNPVRINNTLSLPDCHATFTMTVLYILLLVTNFLILFKSVTVTSIISPWQVIPWYFFITFTISTLLLIIIILKTKLPNFIYLSLLTSYFLLPVSVALIIYTIGYGFDPFIHQATEKLIATQGFVDPKPLYYLGQYALVIIIHKLFFIPIVWIDKLLVPLMSAIFLPPALFHAVKSFGIKTKTSLLTVLLTLIFPFSIFIVTTPQNLAFLFLIILILLNLKQNFTTYDLRLTTIIALATLAIHPIAGIPAVLFVLMFFFCHCETEGCGNPVKIATLPFFTRLPRLFQSLTMTRSIIVFLTFVVAIALPLAFYLNNKTSSIINSITTSDTSSLWQLPQLFLSNTGNFIFNFSYLYVFNIIWIILIFILTGIILSLRGVQNESEGRRSNPCLAGRQAVKNATSYLLMPSALLISYFITKTINFNYLIDYEQSNFADRILIIATIFALPFILITLATLINKILQQNKIVKYSLLIFFTLLITASLYHSYPRWDDYYNSRSYATSKSDIKAVQWIEQNSPDDNYIVLANQQVSVAALSEFGFKKYFQTEDGELFYYPIPTGEKLYQYYLSIADQRENPPQADALPQQNSAGEQASRRARKTALEAADLVNVNTTYFVLNDYWWAFDKILAEAKFEADEIKSIDDGKIFIFKYIK